MFPTASPSHLTSLTPPIPPFGFPFQQPSGASGTHRYVTPGSVDSSKPEWSKLSSDFDSKSQNAASILETQFLNYRVRSSMIVGQDSSTEVTESSSPLNKVFAVGGASSNPVICQTAANILGCKIGKPVSYDPKAREYRVANQNSCSVAAAYKARWGWEKLNNENNKQVTFGALVDELKKIGEKEEQEEGMAVQKNPNQEVENGVLIVAKPEEKKAEIYRGLVEEWKKLEERARNAN